MRRLTTALAAARAWTAVAYDVTCHLISMAMADRRHDPLTEAQNADARAYDQRARARGGQYDVDE